MNSNSSTYNGRRTMDDNKQQTNVISTNVRRQQQLPGEDDRSQKNQYPNHRYDNDHNNNNNNNNTTTTMMEPTDEQYYDGSDPCILWSCVARNDVILAEACSQNNEADEHLQAIVAQTATYLFNKKPTPGWEYTSSPRFFTTQKVLRGMKFHIYDHTEDGQVHIWVVGAVYDPETVEAIQVESFIEKIVGISQIFREHDDTWKYGPTLAAQESFAPILLQRMQEVEYLGKYAMVNAKVEEVYGIMAKNIDLIMDRGEKIEDLQDDATRLQGMAAVFKKKSQQVKRQMLWRNAKNGMVLGTAITAGVAIVVVPPLIAIL